MMLYDVVVLLKGVGANRDANKGHNTNTTS